MAFNKWLAYEQPVENNRDNDDAKIQLRAQRGRKR